MRGEQTLKLIILLLVATVIAIPNSAAHAAVRTANDQKKDRGEIDQLIRQLSDVKLQPETRNRLIDRLVSIGEPTVPPLMKALKQGNRIPKFELRFDLKRLRPWD